MRKKLSTPIFMVLCFTIIFKIFDGGLTMNAVDISGNSEVKLSISIFSGTFKKSDVSKKSLNKT